MSKASRGSEQVPPALTQGLLPFTQPEAGTPPLKLVPAGPDSPGFGETEGQSRLGLSSLDEGWDGAGLPPPPPLAFPDPARSFPARPPSPTHPSPSRRSPRPAALPWPGFALRPSPATPALKPPALPPPPGPQRGSAPGGAPAGRGATGPGGSAGLADEGRHTGRERCGPPPSAGPRK